MSPPERGSGDAGRRAERDGPPGDTSAWPTNPWPPDAPFAERVLREAAIGRLRQVVDSSNFVMLADLSHPEHGSGLAIYKPLRGETPLWDFPPGTIHRREVAAYACSQALGWGLVPPTVLREGPHGPGSLQLFITHDPARHYFTLREDPHRRAALIRIAAFDLVTNNADRKGGHVLVGPGGRLWCIDNGLCFHVEEKLRTVVWDFAGEPIAPGDVEDLRALGQALREEPTEDVADPVADHVAALRELLDAEEIETLSERVAALLAEPVLPEMYPWRCVPWPLV